ncbi:acetylornithine deacetylase [Saccharopolyspora kobensis]|uniref:Acetylornithine deacetylase n=2 Tax=Saccharopolyspora kobensis TaxID=146035 RepID=A0A1H6EIW1_9PSEU|nr:M20 family metallopeptidase [Saccharopolyspora kobensis]SEG97830.1 acetylornithine deacetylase [Saccharopolyspora kobensis]SFF24495.1 acetylornithine deacetylase [Saccharopolyspora kobensis]
MVDPVELIADLVRIPSINPRDRAEPAETALAEHIAEWATARGMRARTEEVLDGRHNVLVELPGDDERPLLLESHLDTVETDGMTIAAFEPEVRDGRLYGRGSCDAKASLAVFLTAMARLAESGPRPRSVVFAGVVDEEHLYRGVTALRRSGLPTPAGAIIGEPTELRMVVAHKGCMRCRIEARGDAGHSSQPWGRTNAIEVAAEVVRHLQQEHAPRLDALARPLVGPPSLAVTMIEGGQGPNVLPDSCVLTIDRRTVGGEDPHEVWAQLRGELEARWPVLVHEPHIVDYSLETDPADPFVRSVAAGLQASGLDADPLGVGYGTDASKIALDGVPAVVFGPGSIADAHTADESVPLDEVRTAVDVVERVLRTGGAPA